jgi:Carbonic anhydrases/acetyltransferases, isoleucine patch superfamily
MIYSLEEKKPSFDKEKNWIADSADLIGDVG